MFHDEMTKKEIQAMMLVRLVEAHKKECDGKCDISVSVLFPVYQELSGDTSNKERSTFM